MPFLISIRRIRGPTIFNGIPKIKYVKNGKFRNRTQDFVALKPKLLQLFPNFQHLKNKITTTKNNHLLNTRSSAVTMLSIMVKVQ